MLGYFSMGRADNMSYIGEYISIVISGKISGWDIYPASHIIGAALSLTSGLSANLISLVLPVIFSLLFTTGLYLFSSHVFRDRIISLIAVPVSFILYLGPYNFLNTPQGLFFALMPLFLYSLIKYYRAYGVAMQAVVVLFILLIPYTHPFIVFFAMCFLVVQVLLSYRYDFLNIGKTKIIYPCILLVGFFIWFISQSMLMASFKARYLSYIQATAEPVFYQTTGKLQEISMSLPEFIKFISLYYGRYFIPCIFIGISILYVFIKRDKINKSIQKKYEYLFILFISFLAIEAILFFNPIITHQPDRMTNLNFIVYAQVPLFSCALYLLFLKNNPSIKALLASGLIITFIWGLSLYGCFDSPYIYQPNNALTYNEVTSMKWFYNVYDGNTIGTILSQFNRFRELFQQGDIQDPTSNLPDHFGYSNSNASFSQNNLAPMENMDIILTTFDELSYQQVPGYSSIGRFNADDFRRLENDSSVNKIYAGLNIEIYQAG
jgi:hypothetical protein